MRKAALGLALWLGAGMAWAGEAAFKAPQESYDYAAAMKEVAAKFKGTPGVFVEFGDSITHANQNTAWARHGQGKPADVAAYLKWTHCGENNEKDGWHLAAVDVPGGRSETAAGGITAAKYLKGGHNGLPSLADLLKKFNPQMALYMLGTNDVRSPVPTAQYVADVEKAMDMIMANGTVPILSTIPPFKGKPKEVDEYNKALRELAAKKKIPLLALHAEMKARRDDIDSYLSDGVHLSFQTPTGPPTEENLKASGYLLRCYLAVYKGMEVKAKVLDK